MQLGPTFDKVVRIAGTVAAVLFLAGAGYLLVQGSRTTSSTPGDSERGFLPAIERIFQSEPPPPSEPPPAKTPSPPSPKTAANCSISSFTADPDAVAPGGSTTLRWSTNGVSAEISNIGAVDPSGSRTVSPGKTTKYILSARCSNGTTVEKGLSVAVEVVTDVSVAVDNSNFTGACPRTFTFTGTITTNSPATVIYQWYNNGVASGGEQTLTFGAAGSQNVTHQWSLSSSGTHHAKLKVLSPNETGDGAEVGLTCQ